MYIVDIDWEVPGMLKTDPFLRADGWVKRRHFGCRRPVPKIDVSRVLQQEQTKRPGRAAAAEEKTARPRAAAARAEKAARHGRWFARLERLPNV